MGRLELKTKQQTRRAHRVRSRIVGTSDRPRLNVKVTNKHIVAQLIDDTKSQTIAYVSSNNKETAKLALTEKAQWCGEKIAEAAKKAKIKSATLDRGTKLYHGRVAALADSARKNGLEI